MSDEEARKNIDITLLRYFQELQLKDEKELFNQNQNLFNIKNSEAILILVSALFRDIEKFPLNNEEELFNKSLIIASNEKTGLKEFIIYSPENTSLRIFDSEAAIQPLGIKGEGLFKLLKVLSHDQKEKLHKIQKQLKLIDWFEEFELPPSQFETEKILQIKDKYLDPDLGYFDQKSSNEGFLFLLFYFTLFISEQLTPSFFAIDNIDASLNPRLCRRLIQELVKLAKKYDKQVILTTHNPAVLDGLDLEDEEQRLFVISRNLLGHTKAQRINQPEPLEGQEPVKLSEAFLRGYIGGLPKNF